MQCAPIQQRVSLNFILALHKSVNEHISLKICVTLNRQQDCGDNKSKFFWLFKIPK